MVENNIRVSFDDILKATDLLTDEEQEALVKHLMVRVRENHYQKIALKAKEAHQQWVESRLMHGSVNDLLADFVLEDVR
jgi:hypothetical protein